MKQRKKQSPPVVPQLPDGYRDGLLPELPPRNEIVSIATSDGAIMPGLQPTGVVALRVSGEAFRVEIIDARAAELMQHETHSRDRWADKALIEILASLEGKELTAEVLHSVRMRLRRFGDDVHCLARIAAAHVMQRERVRKHCKVDPYDVCRTVAAKVATGTTTTDAFIEVGEEIGVAPETIRNAYYKHRRLAGK